MRWANRLAAWVGVLGLALVIDVGCTGTQSGGGGGDDDDDDKSEAGCKYIAGESKQDLRMTPIPAGFFDFDGRTCEAFGDVISYVGKPIDASSYGLADTIVRRDGDPISPADPAGTEGTVDIEIVALSLASAEPITVLCDGAATEWDVRLDLSETVAPVGTLAATKEHANGGTAESTLFVYPRLTFTNADDPDMVRVFDAAAEGLAPVQLNATFPWVYASYPSGSESEAGFLAGVDGRSPARLAGDPAAADAEATCVQYVSPEGDLVHETCLMHGAGM